MLLRSGRIINSDIEDKIFKKEIKNISYDSINTQIDKEFKRLIYNKKLITRYDPSKCYLDITKPISEMLDIIHKLYQNNTYCKLIYLYEIAIYLYKMLSYTNINIIANKLKPIILNKLNQCINTEYNNLSIQYIRDNHIYHIYNSILYLDNIVSLDNSTN